MVSFETGLLSAVTTGLQKVGVECGGNKSCKKKHGFVFHTVIRLMVNEFALLFFDLLKIFLMFGGTVLLTICGVVFFRKAHAFLLLLIGSCLVLVLISWYRFSYMSREFTFMNIALLVIANIIVWALVWKYYNLAVRRRNQQAIELLEQCISEIPNVCIVITDSNDLIIKNSSCAETMFGYDKGELIGNRIGKLFQSDGFESDGSDNAHYFLKYDSDGKRREIKGRKKDGLLITVAVAAGLIGTADGDDLTVLFISEQSNRGLNDEQPLNDLVAIKGAYFDFAPVIFLGLNATGQLLTINKYGCDLIACNRDEVVGLNWFNNFVPASDRDQFIAIFHDCRKTHNEKAFRSHVRDRDHSLKLIQWKGGVDKQSDAFLCVGEDITERESQHVALMRSLSNVNRLKEKLEERVRKRTRELEIINVDLELQIDERRLIEDRLINSQRLYRAIAHNFPNGLIAVLDTKMNFMMIEGQELAMLELSEEELIGKSIFDGAHPLVNESSRTHMENVLTGHSTTFEITRGSAVYSVIEVPLYDQQDTLYAILLVMQNITESKHLEESLYKAIEKEKKLNDLKTRFVTMATHEFRTPLSTILSSLFLMEAYNGPSYEEKKYVHINRIKRTVNMLTETLNDFLRLGKLEEGRVEMMLSEVNIREQVGEINREMQSVARPGQTIHYSHEGLEVTLLLDKTLLYGILNNLLSNAIKYSPEGGEIFLKTSVSSQEFQIVVSDHGIGIAPEEQEHIFQRFFRALNAVNIEGTGLGLHIVKKYVELMNGTIGFSSGDKGTTFTVKIPLQFTPDNTRLIVSKLWRTLSQ